FQASSPAGTTPLNVTINGSVQATNNANNNGIVGFNSGPTPQTVTVLGTGVITGGASVNFGNLNSSTLAPINPPGGTITYSPNLTISNQIILNGNYTPPIPPTPPTPTPSGGGGSISQEEETLLPEPTSPVIGVFTGAFGSEDTSVISSLTP